MNVSQYSRLLRNASNHIDKALSQLGRSEIEGSRITNELTFADSESGTIGDYIDEIAHWLGVQSLAELRFQLNNLPEEFDLREIMHILNQAHDDVQKDIRDLEDTLEGDDSDDNWEGLRMMFMYIATEWSSYRERVINLLGHLKEDINYSIILATEHRVEQLEESVAYLTERLNNDRS